MACVVHGYDEAVAQEQLARNIAYLDAPVIVCGEPLRNLTPHLYTVLSVMRTPFLSGGAYTRANVAQFLWACHADYAPRGLRAWWWRRRFIKRCARLDIQDAAQDIAEFIAMAFTDAPRGGKAEKPIASDTAWIVFRFRHDPWHMTEMQTIHTPFRKLYQELRCWQRENGGAPDNRSDILKSSWLEKLNEAVKNGDLSQKDLDDWNRAIRDGPEALEKWRAAVRARN